MIINSFSNKVFTRTFEPLFIGWKRAWW